jgi:CRP-like cAMP-binding protein/uncharacterized protein (DUF2225 family)
MSRPVSLASKPSSLKMDLRWLAAGQVLCREGEAPGPMYVVVSGAVKVYRADANRQQVELAQLGPGSVIGELAPILNQPRSATVLAIEATQIIEVPLEGLSALARRQGALSRVLAHALHERAGLSAEQLAAIGTRLGVELPADLLQPGESDLPEGPSFAAPEHDRALVYPKEITCPACGARFSALIFRQHKDAPSERSSDFHQVYRSTPTPYDYEIWVCPNDLYAALPADFEDLPAAMRTRIGEAIDKVVQSEFDNQKPEFNVDRNLDLREKALKLALAIYQLRDAKPLRLAAVLHRLAWCARERGNKEAEQSYLAQALGQYRLGYEESDLGGAKEELRVQYLCAELSLRLDNVQDALTFCGQALRHAEIKQFPRWEQMLKDQWSTAREASNNAGSAAA